MPQMSFGSGTTGAWVCLFIYSKVFELGDTLFIVLRKVSDDDEEVFVNYYVLDDEIFKTVIKTSDYGDFHMQT